MTHSSTTRRHCWLSLTVYAIFALLVLALAPLIGSEPLQFKTIFQNLTSDQTWHIDTSIFIDQRLPRVIFAFLVGGALATTGAVFQVILRNPLATPYTLGVTGGGTVGAYIAISIPALTISVGPFSSIQLFALLGAALTLLLIFLLSRRPEGISVFTLLLTGVTIGIFCGAIVLLLSYFATPDRLVTMNRWTMGGVDIMGYSQLAAILPLLLPGLGLLFLQMPALNHIALGDEMAMGHGVDVAALQRNAFIGGGLTTAAVVSLAGPIAFVGLIIPHIIRRFSGYDHRIVLPASFLAGGAFLVLCDGIARTVIAPTEMPVGIITAITGAPFFVYLLLKRKIK
jgi:iron complex transport system permease protein